MCKEDVEKWLDDLVNAKIEFNKISSLEEGKIEARKEEEIIIVDGAEEIAKTADIPYKKVKASDFDVYMIDFLYRGFRFFGCVDL